MFDGRSWVECGLRWRQQDDAHQVVHRWVPQLVAVIGFHPFHHTEAALSLHRCSRDGEDQVDQSQDATSDVDELPVDCRPGGGVQLGPVSVNMIIAQISNNAQKT